MAKAAAIASDFVLEDSANSNKFEKDLDHHPSEGSIDIDSSHEGEGDSAANADDNTKAQLPGELQLPVLPTEPSMGRRRALEVRKQILEAIEKLSDDAPEPNVNVKLLRATAAGNVDEIRRLLRDEVNYGNKLVDFFFVLFLFVPLQNHET